MARRVSSQEVRRLAYKTVESPIGTDLVGVYINSIAKENKRRLTPEEKAIIDWWEYNPEDRVPISVFKFIHTIISFTKIMLNTLKIIKIYCEINKISAIM